MRNKLILIRGIPGTGKSTASKILFPNSLHLENDMFHIHNGKYEFEQKRQKEAISWCIDMTDLSLSKKMDVVVSNTFTKKAYIDSYRRIANLHDCDFEVYRMMGSFKNIHEVPKFIYESMKNNFEDYEGEKFVYPKDDGTYEITENMK